jgi:hypothetical protein
MYEITKLKAIYMLQLKKNCNYVKIVTKGKVRHY